jgi:S1-C subfamily serine protease
MNQARSDGAVNLEAVVVHLTGPFRGTRQHLFSDDISVGTGPDVDIRFPSERAPAVAPNHAALRKTTDGSYVLKVSPGETVFVNGQPADEHALRSGDVLGLGEKGPVLRFVLLRDAPTPHKRMSEALRDCVDGAFRSGGSGLGRVWRFMMDLPRELFTQTAPSVRVALVGLALLTLGSVVTLAVFGFRLEQRITEEGQRVSDVEATIREQAEQISDPELQARFDELSVALSTRVEALELLNDAGRRIVSTAEPSVVFLQGAYGWRAPDGRPLRMLAGPDGRILRGPGGSPLTSLEGDGPPFTAEFTGSGFLVDGEGLVVTNRHVAIPWSVDEATSELRDRGFEPELRLIAYAPGISAPFEAGFVTASPSSDLALLRAPELAARAAPLPLSSEPSGPGDEILVLGYPAGINALLARSGSVFVDSLLRSRPDFWKVVEHLSASDLIRPLASRGIVGQVTPATVVYDAETTRGGSGGPVLSLKGEVVAVTYGVLEGFGGSNLGVPVEEVRRLIEVAGAGNGGPGVEIP